MERFRCQSRCLGQKATPGLLVHREFPAETAETANKGQQEHLAHKVLLVLLVHKAPRERKAHRAFLAKMACLDQRETLVHRAFLALQDETAEKANKVLLALLVHKVLLARRERRATKETKVTQEAHLQTSCLST